MDRIINEYNFIYLNHVECVNYYAKKIKIQDLIINLKNPRFEPTHSQSEALNKMISEKGNGLKNLAEDISINGISPIKRFIVIQKGKKFYPADGNRRLIAIKLLQDPKLAPIKLQKHFENLSKTAKIPKDVDCVIFNNDEDARHWITVEHQGEMDGVGTVRWGAMEKRRYKTNKTMIEGIFKYADDNNIPHENISVTTLERIFTFDEIQKMIGISFNENNLNCIKPKKVVNSYLTKIFTAVHNKDIDSRKANSKVDTIKIINGLLDVSHPITKYDDEEQAKGKSTRTARSSTDRKHLIPKTCNLNVKTAKIKNIYVELKEKLVLNDGTKSTPIAVAVIFRVFLEISVTWYLKEKINFNTEEFSLNKKLKKVASYMEEQKIATKAELKHINTVTSSDRNNHLNIQYFNDIVHSIFIQTDQKTLKTMWENYENFFVLMWN